MICGNAAGTTSHTIRIRDHVDLDAAQTRESAPARVKGLCGGGGQARFKLTATYPLSGTVAGNGQELCTHEDALTQVAHCGPCRFGQSEIYSARPVTDSFEQARMHTVPTT